MLDLSKIKLIDLTQTLHAEIPTWEGGCGFQLRILENYAQQGYQTNKIDMLAGIGTHMDAPSHFIEGAGSISEIPLQNLFAPGVVINVAAKAHPNYAVTPQDIFDFEMQYGKIPQKSCVIVATGWEKWWENSTQYRNNLIFPFIAKETAELLLKRDIVGLGVDTLSPDPAGSDFPVHHLLLGAGKYIIENITNTTLLPPIGAKILALPIKIAKATEAPIRLIAFIPV